MSLYDDLGVPADASSDLIRKAYRRKAQRLHPDKKGGDAHAFHEVQRAYETLGDPERRAEYDRTGSSDRPKDLHTQALEEVAGLILRAIESLDVDHDDIVKRAADAVKESQKQINKQISEMRNAIDRLGRALRRMKRIGAGENKLAEVIKATIGRREMGLELAAKQLEKGELMLLMLAGYHYEFDELTDDVRELMEVAKMMGLTGRKR